MRNVSQFILILLIFGVGGAAYYFYDQNQQKDALLANPSELVANERQAVIDKVGQLIELPTGEDPQVVVVQDLEPLKDQEFFNNAKIGDQALIYLEAKKAFLYRPSSHKIIEVGPVTVTATPTASATTSASPTSTKTTSSSSPSEE